MDEDIDSFIDYYRIAPKWREPIPKEMMEHMDEIIKKCPKKSFVTTDYGRFLFNMPKKSIYMIYRRYDVLHKSEWLNCLSVFIEICKRKGIKFFYEPSISN